jgi:hypothetical protein
MDIPDFQKLGEWEDATFRIKPNWCKEIALTTSETLDRTK